MCARRPPSCTSRRGAAFQLHGCRPTLIGQSILAHTCPTVRHSGSHVHLRQRARLSRSSSSADCKDGARIMQFKSATTYTPVQQHCTTCTVPLTWQSRCFFDHLPGPFNHHLLAARWWPRPCVGVRRHHDAGLDDGGGEVPGPGGAAEIRLAGPTALRRGLAAAAYRLGRDLPVDQSKPSRPAAVREPGAEKLRRQMAARVLQTSLSVPSTYEDLRTMRIPRPSPRRAR